MDTVELTRSDATDVTFNGRHAYQVSVAAVSTFSGLSSKVLVVHSGAGVDGNDIFSCVASLPQMQDLPEDSVGTEGTDGYPFYRVDSINFLGYTIEELDSLWVKIIEDTQDLVDNFKLSGGYTNQITKVLE